MEAADGIGLAGEKQMEQTSNGSGVGNVGLEVGRPDVIANITSTSGFGSPKGDGQNAADPDHSSPSAASTSGEQATITKTITTDTIDTHTTSTTPTPRTSTTSQPPNPPSPIPSKPTTPMSTAIAVRTAAPTLPTPSLSDLSLHSPSSQIIGTPFASSSMPERFEYPFPDTPSSSPPPGASTTSPHATPPHSAIASISPMMVLTTGPNHALANASIVPPPNMAPPPASSSSAFQYASSPHYASASTAHVPSRAATLPYSVASGSPSHVHAQAEAPAAGPVYPTYSTYAPAHPMLRAQASAADPPVPPSLAKKRRGWNLGLLGRRRSATAPPEADGQRSPLGSPRNDSEHGR
ncbi:hypothetical protein BJ912DRAFT_89215 [Pholiota molesta]|nr:hypothetical protein BJ912DRAFT_89215 [Pholiota molesta]